jgi:integrase
MAGKREARPKITTEQVASFVAHVPEPVATLILFVAVTGVRIGEAVGIKWSDFDGDVLHVQRRIYERREGTPKTRSSDRHIPIPAALLARLRTLGDGEWIFRTSAGTPLDPKNAMNRHLRPAATAVGMKLGGWHSFRHAFSTKLLRKYPVKVVSEILGHSDSAGGWLPHFLAGLDYWPGHDRLGFAQPSGVGRRAGSGHRIRLAKHCG